MTVRKIVSSISVGLLLMFGAILSFAQNTATLTGTVIDSDSVHWDSATWTYSPVNASGPLANICGGAQPGTVFGTLSSTGVFSGSLITNQCISPANTQWQLRICSLSSAPCLTLPSVTINTSSYNAGTFASANITAPRFSINGVGFGYAIGEVNSPITPGSLLFITLTGASCTLEVWTGASWSCASSSGGMNQLTGDVAAGPGTGSQVATAINLPGHVALTGTPAAGNVPTATDATHATWQPAGASSLLCPTGSASNAVCQPYPNDSAGTGINLLACWTTSNVHQTTIATCPASAAENGTDMNPTIVGVVVAGAGTTGFATVQIAGTAPWICDATIVADGSAYWVQPSATAAGQCHQPTGSFAPSPNENPEGNTVLGRPVAVNTGAGTIAQIALLPFGSYGLGNGAGTNGGFFTSFALLMNGSPFGSMSHCSQAPSIDVIPYAVACNGFYFNQPGTNKYGVLGNLHEGQSGNDISYDPLRWGSGIPSDTMWRWDGSWYTTPSQCGNSVSNCSNTSGTVTLGSHTGNFDPGNSTGLYILTLANNATTFTPVTDDNVGHVLTFTITPNTFAWTWPSGTPGFINAPTISNSATPITTTFLFDGTNYQCLTNCANSIVANRRNCMTTSTCSGGVTYTFGTTLTNNFAGPVVEEVQMISSGAVLGDATLMSTVGGLPSVENGVFATCTGVASVTFVVPAGVSFAATPAATSNCSSAGTQVIGSWWETTLQ